MPHSLRAKLSGLRYKKIISDKDYDRLCKALEQERSRSAEIIQYRHDCEKLMEENEQLKKALEQEPILDKIRAEIEDIAFDWQEIDGEHESFMVVDLNDVLQIIDRYRESEEV